MSFIDHSHVGVFTGAELQMLQRVFDRLDVEGLVPAEPKERDEFSAYMIRIYRHGMCDEQRLMEFCRVAAMHKHPVNQKAEKACS